LPSIAISSPVATGGTYNTGTATVNVSGTASDNVGVVSVYVANNRGGGGTASGTTNWSAEIALQSGANTITVSAFDATGLFNQASITVNYTVTQSTGTLNVTTTPVKGDIYVDGTLRGNEWISISLPAGSHTVSFGEVSGYTTPAQRSVTITANETVVIAVAYDVIVLGKVNLLSPSNDATGVSITPTFAWSGVNGANRYWLMVATDPSHFPTDPNATSCLACVISGSTAQTSHRSDLAFDSSAEGGKPGTLNANTTYYWKVQAWNTNGAYGNYSDAFRFTTVAPESEQPKRSNPLVSDCGAPIPAAKAIVMTHGWNAKASDWVAEMAEDFCKKLGPSGPLCPVQADKATKVCQVNGWDVWVEDWRTQAAKGTIIENIGGYLRFPADAFTSALLEGEALASTLKGENYQHIHFVAHSAGSNLIEAAARWLRVWKSREGRPEDPPLTIHETFLDAYDPGGELSLYGASADWADNYVDTRDVVAPGFPDGTKLFLKEAYNVDVTPVWASCGPTDIDGICRHSRPVRFYGYSMNKLDWIDEKYHEYNQHDPIESAAGKGYPLSEEAGVSLETLKDTYKKGEACGVSGDACYPNYHPIPVFTSYFGMIAGQVIVEAVQGTVDYVQATTGKVFDRIELGWREVTSLVPQQMHAMSAGTTSGATTEEPSYLAVNVTTTSPVNTLHFNWSFAAPGEGLLRVFVGGNLVREIDQRYVTPSSPETEEIYIGGVGEPLPPGTHRITFRLDGFGADASGVELTDVELGLKAGPLTFPADTLPVGEQGVAYVYDLLAEGGMPPYTWSLIKGKLPGGLTLDTAGTITGTPTKAKTKTFTVQVTDGAGGSATQTLSLQIVKGVTIKTKKLKGGTVGTPYSSLLKTKGGIAPLIFSVVGGTLPPGLTLDPGTGQVSGTPTVAGTFDFAVQVTSSGGSSHQKNIRIKTK
ncbi:MAG: putative Ig domain-containing protein, partial [Kofleriaceae bacterium]|nr:putative Ig domain-containing protein [Candidatus Methylomirabilis lanthanidiphila]